MNYLIKLLKSYRLASPFDGCVSYRYFFLGQPLLGYFKHYALFFAVLGIIQALAAEAACSLLTMN